MSMSIRRRPDVRLGPAFARHAAISCMLAAALLATETASAAAAERDEAELQAEIARLQQLLDARQRGDAAPAQDGSLAAAGADAGAATQTAQAELATSDAAIDEVLVTSVRDALAEVKEIPTSISVVTGEELDRFQVTRFQDVLRKLGNVRLAGPTGLVTGQNLAIRGIGFPGGSPQDPGIGTTVDGVSYAFTDMAGQFAFYDLESVDVARGPQGSSGGLGANYGRISFTTRAPGFTPEAEASITAGQRDTLITRAAIGGAVIDKLLAWRGTFYREQADGAFVNHYDETQSLFNKDRTSARLQFLLLPADTLRGRFSFDITPKGAEYGSSSAGAFTRATPEFYDSIDPNTGSPIRVTGLIAEKRLARRWFQQEQSYEYLDENGEKNRIERSDGPPQERKTRGTSAQFDWELSGLTLSSISAWRDYAFDWHGKNTALRDIFDIQREPTQAWTYYKQLSEELRIASPSGGRVDYVAGLYYLDTTTRSGKPTRGTRLGSDAGAYYATDTQYASLDADAAGRTLLFNSVNRLNLATEGRVNGEKRAAFGDLNWHFTDEATLGLGLRISDERSAAVINRSYISNQGYAPELNPASVNDVWLGGFNSTPAGELDAKKGNSAEQLALADATALKYFGVASYAALSTTQKQQIAHAKAIRQARIGSLYQNTGAEPFDDVLIGGHISPSYKLDENHTAYFSYQHGEKAGVSQIVGATVLGGTSAPVKPEKTDAYELGLKSALADNISLNVAVFYQDIRNYIQSLYYYDPVQTQINNDGNLAYTQGLGNVPKIVTKGVEFDATYTGTYLTLRLAGAYNDPKYKRFEYAAKPPELGGTSIPYYDVSGRTIPGASKFNANFSADYVRPVFSDKEFHTSFNYNYVSSFNSSATLSRYNDQEGYGLADLAIGLGTRNRKFDVTLLVRNLFDKDYGSLYDWTSYTPSEPRWAGLSFSGKFL